MARTDDDARKPSFTVNDRRWWLDERDDAAEPEQVDPAKPTYVEQLEEQLAEQGKRLTELQQAHKQVREEMSLVRTRLERDQERRLAVEKARLAEPFVEVVDNLERLLLACDQQGRNDPLHQGAELVLRQLHERLAGLGLEPIAAAGAAFDPNLMEAMATAKVEPEREGQVLDVIRSGYRLGERVVRPAGVRVGVARSD